MQTAELGGECGGRWSWRMVFLGHLHTCASSCAHALVRAAGAVVAAGRYVRAAT